MIEVTLFVLMLICSRNILIIRASSDPNVVEGENIEAILLFKETHYVTTEDGYILTIHRMPGPPGSFPVFIQHGLIESSGDFVASGESSLPYLLSVRGYDIWLGNCRGNTFSKRHVTLSPSDPRFWDFSWSEVGYYDIPAMVSYVSNYKNGSSMFYVGHSMGNTVFAVMAIERPEIAKKIRAYVGMAPAVFAYGDRSPLELIAPFWNPLYALAKAVGIFEVFAHTSFYDFLANNICSTLVLRHICSSDLFIIGGFSPAQLNYDILPIIFSEFPAGTSTKLFVHFLQQVNVNRFRKFDYGEEGNLIHYNSTEPPDYDITKIDVPSAVFYSLNDYLVDKQNALDFYAPLPRKINIYELETFNHFDFLWGIDAPELVYSTIFDIFDRY